MPKRLILTFMICASCVLQIAAAPSQAATLEAQVQELTQMVRQLQLTVENQQREIAQMKAVQETRPAMREPARVPAAGRQLLGRWNPDIGVVADTVVRLDSPKEDKEGADRLSVRELEMVFGSPLDPYSRLDVTVAFSDFEEPALEEAYLTHFALPWEIKGRVGRFKPRVGKAIPLHRDSLDTVDEPLVIERWFGAEGYNKSGVDFSKILDLPLPSVHEISFGILEGGSGEGGTAFGETRRRPTLYTHLKNYFDVSDATSVEFGISHIAGSRDEDAEFEVQILGMDGTLIHYLNPNQTIKLQGEAFYMSRSGSEFEAVDEDTGDVFLEDLDDNRSLWGAYVLVDLRISRWWAAGFRYDYVELAGLPGEEAESGEEEGEPFMLFGEPDRAYTGYLTFYQSEFARWRAQFSHIDRADGEPDNRVLIQGTFAIGEHKHKLE